MITRIGVSVLQEASQFQEKREAVFRPELPVARKQNDHLLFGKPCRTVDALLSEDLKAPEPANGTQACRVRRMASGESDKHVS